MKFKPNNTMKKLTSFSLITFCVFFFAISSVAQRYQPMPTQNATWSSVRCWYFYPAGWHDEYSVSLNGTDTTLNSNVYTKLMLRTHHAPGTVFDSVYTDFLGGMREVGKRIYFFSDYLCGDTIERLIYDFNPANIGDTIRTQVLSNLTNYVDHIVTAVDSVQMGSVYHRRLTLADPNGISWENWVEGVGSSLGLTYATYFILSDNSYDLTCFQVKDVVLYSNPSPSYGFCTPPLPLIICDSALTSVSEVSPEVAALFYPNPTKEFLSIRLLNTCKFIRITDVTGQEQCCFLNTDVINVSILADGLYFVQFLNEANEVISVGSVVKE